MGLPAYQLPEAATPVLPEDYLRLESPQAVLNLSSIGCRVPLAEVYEGVQLVLAEQ